MKEMVMILPASAYNALGNVRTIPRLAAARHGGQIWLRGISPHQPEKALRQLPVLHTYLLDAEERLFLPGKRTPHSALPCLSWEPMFSFIKAELPMSALPARLQERYMPVLAPSGVPAEVQALLTSLQTWKEYAETAPLIRLQRLRFAATEVGQVLITGTPLPPIPGKAYTIRYNILLPAGYDFDLPALASLTAARLNPENDALLLFHVNGQWERIPAQNFVRATRSAIRLTHSVT